MPQCQSPSSLVLEALKGLLLRDLGQMASLQVEQVFAETPKVTITIRPL
jgi:Holliday junction resolvase RusA-like endonuclease